MYELLPTVHIRRPLEHAHFHNLQDTSDAKYKIKLCRVWLDSCGYYCNYGSKCSYAHGVHELRICTADVPESGPLISSRDCFHPFLKPLGPSGAPPSAVSKSFKSHLCRQWLDAAALAIRDAAAERKSFALKSQTEWCPRRETCEHAHGLAELRLPSPEETQMLLNAVARDAIPGSPSSVSHVSPTTDSLGSLEQFLLLTASCLMVPVLPVALLHRVNKAASPAYSGSSLLPQFADLPPRLARVLATAAANPMLPIAMSAKQHIEAPRSADLARIVAIMGYDASNAAIALAASATDVGSERPMTAAIDGELPEVAFARASLESLGVHDHAYGAEFGHGLPAYQSSPPHTSLFPAASANYYDARYRGYSQGTGAATMSWPRR
jgi:hypothetical protein